ncbi:helix-turn-helix domain-containing protein [Flavobacterium beibuense]|uniref:Transcriptional regulator, AraC family n=1 Tax=Flavobacterium beibuense TaxID=657326 RepID=A0A444W4A0_9FLAO|nr:helix-turn-helix transcriptional regulator [Flavobacterium beibuense]RYJ40526.1 Transcriptional regulator, AraC family [Flavobacterium beibuense]
MEQDKNTPYCYNSLFDLHRMLGLPKPLHPLISLINISNNILDNASLPNSHTSVFYKISYKENLSGKLKYGQSYYDFDEGGLLFVSPNQVTANGENNGDHTGYTLIVHPDFLLSYPIAKSIKQYGFFSYSANEALHLSSKEKKVIISIFKNIDDELQERIDNFSQDIVISLIELLLSYSNRFYKRQFITRKAINNNVLQKLEELLDTHFQDKNLSAQGLPTVQYLSQQLNLSPSYLSDMLRSLTGQSTQQYIHNRLIETAKEKLSTTALSVSEIAYELGFEHSQSFSRLFKIKTNLSPIAFRRTFN